MTAAAVLSVGHGGHENTSTTLSHVSKIDLEWCIKKTYSFLRALASQAFDLAIAINLVVLEHSKLGFLALVLDLLGSGVDLLLSLLATTSETEDEMEG